MTKYDDLSNSPIIKEQLIGTMLGAPMEKAPFDDSMTSELQSHITWLEKCALSNQKDARRDAIAFWALKIPAIAFSASAGIWSHFELKSISLIAGAIASFCVIVDGVYPHGLLRNTHLRAFYDLRDLTSEMFTKWNSRDSGSDKQKIASQIIKESEINRKRIAQYVRDAETTLKVNKVA